MKINWYIVIKLMPADQVALGIISNSIRHVNKTADHWLGSLLKLG